MNLNNGQKLGAAALVTAGICAIPAIYASPAVAAVVLASMASPAFAWKFYKGSKVRRGIFTAATPLVLILSTGIGTGFNPVYNSPEQVAIRAEQKAEQEAAEVVRRAEQAQAEAARQEAEAARLEAEAKAEAEAEAEAAREEAEEKEQEEQKEEVESVVEEKPNKPVQDANAWRGELTKACNAALRNRFPTWSRWLEDPHHHTSSKRFGTLLSTGMVGEPGQLERVTLKCELRSDGSIDTSQPVKHGGSRSDLPRWR